MCRNNCSRCKCRENRCDRWYRRCEYRDNRCDDFVWPMLIWMVRDMTRRYRCNFVDRYDRFRC